MNKMSRALLLEVPAYLVLTAKGYGISPTGSQSVLWLAQKDQNTFSAESMLELLGVVATAENLGLNWRATDEEIEAFLMKCPTRLSRREIGRPPKPSSKHKDDGPPLGDDIVRL